MLGFVMPTNSLLKGPFLWNLDVLHTAQGSHECPVSDWAFSDVQEQIFAGSTRAVPSRFRIFPVLQLLKQRAPTPARLLRWGPAWHPQLRCAVTCPAHREPSPVWGGLCSHTKPHKPGNWAGISVAAWKEEHRNTLGGSNRHLSLFEAGLFFPSPLQSHAEKIQPEQSQEKISTDFNETWGLSLRTASLSFIFFFFFKFKNFL